MTTTRRRLITVAVPAAVLLAAVSMATFVGLTAQRGVGNDPRVRNPDPGSAPIPPNPMLGFHHWSRVWEVLFLVVALVIFVPLVRAARRQRQLTQPLIVYLGMTSLSIIDPPINWPSYTAYNPDALHFPSTWPWAAFAPTTEPLMVLPGYSVFYFAIGWIATIVFDRWIEPRLRSGGRARRHPIAARFGFAFCFGYLCDVALELIWLRQRLYVYSQTAGPAIRWDWVTLPATESVAMALCMAFAGAMMWRNDSAETAYSLVKHRLRIGGGDPRRGLFVAAVLLSFGMYVGVLGWYSIWRVGDLATTPYSGAWPFPETGVYDPDGVLREAGKPGPYYDDWWEEQPCATAPGDDTAASDPDGGRDHPCGRG